MAVKDTTTNTSKEDQTRIEVVNLKDLHPWEDNPRTVKDEDFKRLKKQIKRLGVYKPLLVNQDNIILGGNMRYMALLEMGYEKVHVAVVETKNSKQMVEYALSDNDSIGTTDESKVAELVTLHKIRDDLFSVQLKPLTPVSVIVNKVGPGKEPDVSFNTSDRACPACGFEGKTGEFKKVQ